MSTSECNAEEDEAGLEWIIDLLRQAACEPPPWEQDRVVLMLRDLGYDI